MSSDQSLKIEHVPVAETNLQLFCDESIPSKLRPLVPAGHRRSIFTNINNLSHPNIKATTRVVTDPYVCPGVEIVERNIMESKLHSMSKDESQSQQCNPTAKIIYHHHKNFKTSTLI